MWGVAEMLRSRLVPRAAVLALVAAGVAACSADTSRFNENPFASLSQPDATASIPQGPAPRSAPATAATSAGTGSGKAVALNSPARSGSADAAGSVVRKLPANWSWDGGTAVTVAAGDSVEAIARRYGVPTSVIMQANNISAPATLHPGQRLVIPRYTATRVATAAAPRVPAPAPSAAVNVAGSADVHIVTADDTLNKISHHYHKSVNEIAKANNIQPTTTLNVGDLLIIPGAQASAVKASAPVAAAQPKPVAASPPPKEPEPVQSASVVAPTDSLDKEAAKLADANGAVPKFRWPANGRVIAGYG